MTFLEILILIVTIALSIIAIRISFKFDINKFLENKRKIKLDQLKNICPHMKISHYKGNSFSFESYFSSPRGTSKWFCSQCGCVVESQEDVDRIMKPYIKNINLYLKRKKRFIKKAKKLKII
jgi:uncharacterized protein (UPF0216 family)